MIVKEKSNYAPPPAGTHIAICIGYVDLGTQVGSYEGQPTSALKVRLLWELCDELRDGVPIQIGATYTQSTSKNAKLRAHLQSWRGRPFTEEELGGFSMIKIVGASCMLTIIHEPKQGGGVRDSITAITPVHKSTTVPKQVAPRIVYDIDEHTDAVFDKVPSYLQEWILKSPEGQAARNGNPKTQSGYATGGEVEQGEGIPF